MSEQTDPSALTPVQLRDLRAVAALMIPASAAYAAPSADDPKIMADVVASLSRDSRRVRAALDALAAMAALAGGEFAELDASRRGAIAAAWRADPDTGSATVTRLILQSYYRDDRVVRSLGLEPRPPFPMGNVLEHGDWTLLDPVRGRAPMWREAG